MCLVTVVQGSRVEAIKIAQLPMSFKCVFACTCLHSSFSYDFTTTNWNIEEEEDQVLNKQQFPDLILVRKVNVLTFVFITFLLRVGVILVVTTGHDQRNDYVLQPCLKPLHPLTVIIFS